MFPLIFLNIGEKGEIVEIKNKRSSLCDSLGQIENMGIRTGKIVEVLKNNLNDPLLIKVNDSRIALGRSIAVGILVRKLIVNKEKL